MCGMNLKTRQADDFRAGIYARVSSDQQAEAATIATRTVCMAGIGESPLISSKDDRWPCFLVSISC